MRGLTRGPITLLSAGVAGFLVWLATEFDRHHTGGYWAATLVVAGAGLVMALGQLLGGWTKWGWPRVAPSVLLVAFVPALICVGWIVVAGQPHASASQSHVVTWSGDIGLRGAVLHLVRHGAVLAFGLGLLLGFSLDTTGPPIAAPPGEADEWEPTIERPGSPPESAAMSDAADRGPDTVGASAVER